jgi:hypothetical protein
LLDDMSAVHRITVGNHFKVFDMSADDASTVSHVTVPELEHMRGFNELAADVQLSLVSHAVGIFIYLLNKPGTWTALDRRRRLVDGRDGMICVLCRHTSVGTRALPAGTYWFFAAAVREADGELWSTRFRLTQEKLEALMPDEEKEFARVVRERGAEFLTPVRQ